MHRKLLLIVNPAAGRGAYKKDFEGPSPSGLYSPGDHQ